ncbi:hypothetical protein [Leifsonia sp. NPDC077715]|uniref:hypothetical protein n=1 Tax=Leifsonia sp. NPDC077715 TaxID=3155539 RepID=UPI0034315BA0
MKRWWERRWRTVLIVILALALIVVGSLLLKWLGLDSNAFAAVASALAAIAAFASARESSATAREAARALAFATKPSLHLEIFNLDNPPLMLSIENTSLHRIGGANVRWELRDGRTGNKQLGPLEGRAVPYAPHPGSRGIAYELVDLGPFEWTNGRDYISVDYWGVNSSVRWRLKFEALYQYSSDGRRTGTGFGQRIVSDEELP